MSNEIEKDNKFSTQTSSLEMSDKELEDENYEYYLYSARETVGKIPVAGFFLARFFARYAVRRYVKEIRNMSKQRKSMKISAEDIVILE